MSSSATSRAVSILSTNRIRFVLDPAIFNMLDALVEVFDNHLVEVRDAPEVNFILATNANYNGSSYTRLEFRILRHYSNEQYSL